MDFGSKRILHITARQNLRQILAAGGLWSKSELLERGLAAQSIAHSHIQARRAEKMVPIAPGGPLSDYIPWGFAPCSPMLCAIAHRRLEAQSVSQADVIYLISRVARVQNAGLSWVFSDGHAANAFTSFFDDEAQGDVIDWELMKAQWWNNTADDPDRTRRRQAEFLIHSFAPWSIVTGIATRNPVVADDVRTILAQAGQNVPVESKPQWYF